MPSSFYFRLLRQLRCETMTAPEGWEFLQAVLNGSQMSPFLPTPN